MTTSKLPRVDINYVITLLTLALLLAVASSCCQATTVTGGANGGVSGSGGDPDVDAKPTTTDTKEHDDVVRSRSSSRKEVVQQLTPFSSSVATTTKSSSSSSKCMNVTRLHARIGKWVGKVPYSHLVNASWGYPTDCSGFVSWALQTKASVGRGLKAYEYSASAFSQRIGAENLRFGDIITHVWDHTPLNRCSGNQQQHRSEELRRQQHKSDPAPHSLLLPALYISGHVIFFAEWANANHTEFWAYESTETADQTPACLQQKGPLTRSKCFNHYVKKVTRKTIGKWSEDTCHDSKYGLIRGGPRRLLPNILCT